MAPEGAHGGDRDNRAAGRQPRRPLSAHLRRFGHPPRGGRLGGDAEVRYVGFCSMLVDGWENRPTRTPAHLSYTHKPTQCGART
jgi:hypothetical protein